MLGQDRTEIVDLPSDVYIFNMAYSDRKISDRLERKKRMEKFHFAVPMIGCRPRPDGWRQDCEGFAGPVEQLLHCIVHADPNLPEKHTGCEAMRSIHGGIIVRFLCPENH